MGYYTYYTVLIEEDPEFQQDEFWKDIVELDVACEDIEPGFAFEAKWYDHEEDLQRISKKYPKMLIIVYGEGEESEDFWKLFIRNGKSHRVRGEVVYPEFDTSTL